MLVTQVVSLFSADPIKVAAFRRLAHVATVFSRNGGPIWNFNDSAYCSEITPEHDLLTYSGMGSIQEIERAFEQATRYETVESLVLKGDKYLQGGFAKGVGGNTLGLIIKTLREYRPTFRPNRKNGPIDVDKFDDTFVHDSEKIRQNAPQYYEKIAKAYGVSREALPEVMQALGHPYHYQWEEYFRFIRTHSKTFTSGKFKGPRDDEYVTFEVDIDEVLLFPVPGF